MQKLPICGSCGEFCEIYQLMNWPDGGFTLTKLFNNLWMNMEASKASMLPMHLCCNTGSSVSEWHLMVTVIIKLRICEIKTNERNMIMRACL